MNVRKQVDNFVFILDIVKCFVSMFLHTSFEKLWKAFLSNFSCRSSYRFELSVELESSRRITRS